MFGVYYVIFVAYIKSEGLSFMVYYAFSSILIKVWSLKLDDLYSPFINEYENILLLLINEYSACIIFVYIHVADWW